MRNTIIDWVARIVIPVLVVGTAWAAWRWFTLLAGYRFLTTLPFFVFVAIALLVVAKSYIEVYWLRSGDDRDDSDGGPI